MNARTHARTHTHTLTQLGAIPKNFLNFHKFTCAKPNTKISGCSEYIFQNSEKYSFQQMFTMFITKNQLFVGLEGRWA